MNLLISFKKSLALFIAGVILGGSAFSQVGATALNFDGVNDYVTIPVINNNNAGALNISSAITIEAWINPSKSTGTQDVLCKSMNSPNNGYVFPRTSDGWKTIEFLLNINGYGWKVLKVIYGQAKLNQWHHVAASYDGLKMRIFIDGTQAGEYAFAGSITINNNPLTVGNQPGFNEYFGGSVDEIRVWNRAIIGCEILNNMTCQLGGTQNGLAAYYQFNQGLVNAANTGISQLNDSGPSLANGTLMNFGYNGLVSNWCAGSSVTGTCAVYTPPVISAGSLQSVVPIGGTISLTASSNVAGSTYAWVGPNGFTSTQQNPVIAGASLAASGTYTVTITGNGCATTASTIVTVALMASALNFDGVDDYISVPFTPSVDLKTFTVETWINPTTSITPVQNIVSNASRASNNGFKFPKTNDGWTTFSFELSVNNQWQTVSAPFPASALGQWNHLAATYDGYFMKMYLNGALVAISEVTGTFTNNTNNLIIGNQDGVAEYFKGSIDELRIWSRAQSQCEIINNMKTCELNGDNNGMAQQIGLSAYYRLNQGLINVSNAAVTTAADSSGHANDGTLYNFNLNGSTSTWVQGKVNGVCAYFPQPLLSASANGSAFQVGSTVKLFAVNGNGSYSWDGPNSFVSIDSTPVIPNVQQIQAGTYTVSTPYTNCVVTASTRFRITTASQIIANGPTNICPSGSVTLSSASQGTSYQWYKNDVAIVGETNNQYVANQTGNYTVTITNAADVTVSAPIAVTVVPDILAPVPDAATLPALTINVGATVTAIPTATDNCRGTVNGTANQSLTFNTLGTFTIVWTYDDLNGNTSVQNQQVTVLDNVPPVLTVPSNMSVQAVSGVCSAVANFTATATDNSGLPVNITYSINPGSTFALGATTVNVTATDASNNSSSGSFIVTVTPAAVAPITGNTTICAGSTGTLSSATIGGSWSSNNTAVATVDATGVVTALAAGTANISYTDACGSSVTAAITVNPLPSVPVVTVVNNCGSSTLSTNAAGTLLWSTGVNTPSVAVNAAGTYTVTQTVNGCTSAAGSGIALPLVVPAAPAVSVTNNCGTSTLSTNATGTLLWNTGANTPSITVIGAGTYSVTQTSVNGCTSAAGTGTSAPVAIPSAPVVTVTDNCGSSVLSTNATGSLLWSTGSVASSITVTTGGTYTVTQTVNGCVSAAGSGSAAPNAIPSTPVVTVADNCGTSTLSTNAAGTLLWSTGANTPSITVSGAGTYSVTQTVGGCTSAAGSGNASPMALPATPVVTVTNNCGTSTLSTNATGTLLWNTGANTPSITVIGAGTYTVTQTVNGCTSVAGSGLAAPNAIPSAPVVTVTDNCGSSVLSTNATGSLLWSTGSVASSITVTTGGTYTVTQTVNGCVSAAGSGSAAPNAIPSTPVVTVADNCGTSTLSTNAAGTLLWSTGANTPSITVSGAGTYSVTQAVGGCTSAAGSGNASPMAVPAIPVVTVANNCGSSTLSTNATGTLLWNTGANTPSITVIGAGTYSVTQTSVNGCTSAAGTGTSAPVAIPSAPVVTVTDNCGSSVLSTNATGSLLWSTGSVASSITVTTGGTYTVTQTVNGCVSAAGSGSAAPNAIPSAPVVTVADNCGTSTLSTNAAGTLLWSTGANTPSITVSGAGTYSVTQTVGGCTSAATLATAAPLAIPSAPVVTAADNCGTSTLSTNAAGTLLWSTGENTSSIIVSNGGAYTVTQTINGCTSTAGSGTAAPKAVAATPVITVVNNCGSSTLSTNANGSLLWSNLATASSVNVTASGNYSVTVTNANGCSATSAVTAVSVNTIPVVGAITGVTTVTAGSATQLSDGSAGGVWTSSNTAIATVNASGLVTGVTAGSATITYTVTGAGGCSTAVTATVTVNPSCVTPVFTAISNISVNAVSGCAAPVTYTTSVTGNPALTYIFSGATSGTGSGSGSGAAFNLGTTTVAITAINACGTATISFSVTVMNAAPVTATITPANADAFCNSVVLTGNANAATYQWVSPNGNTYANTAQISLGQGNAEGVYHLYVTGDNGCTGSTGATYNYQRQNLANSYAILAFSKVQLGNNNTVNGGVGVTSAGGYVGLGSYTNITAPGSFVKAANISTRGWGINVTNLIHSAATGIGLPTMYYNTASTKKLPDASVKEQTVTTLNGNYGELTLKKGSITTLTGNIFGSIKVEQGAQVIFATSSTVNIDELEVDKGPRNGYTYIRFSQDTKVLISSHVSIGSNCFVNPDNNKVTFYLGDTSPDDEKFTVKGGDTKVNANVYVPKGAIKVTGGYQYGDYGGGHNDNEDEDDEDRYHGQGNAIVYMTGFYIADQVSSEGKNVVWNTFDCSAAPVSVINTSTSVQQVAAKTATSEISVVKAATTEEELKITVMPNPSTTYFTLKLESKYETPVNMRVMDASGRVVDAKSKIGSNSTIQIGASYASGTYYAEMIQGTHHKVVQLLKIK